MSHRTISSTTGLSKTCVLEGNDGMVSRVSCENEGTVTVML